MSARDAGLPRWRWLLVVLLLGVVIAGFFDRISIAVLFSNVDFYTTLGTGFNPPLLGALMTAFLIPYGLSALFLSFTGDMFGPRRTLIAAAAIWGALMVLMGFTSSYGVMIGYRIVLGITEGPQFSWIMKVVKRWFPQREHGRANSIWLIGSPIGSAIGFPLAIWIVSNYGWRASFYVLGALNLLIVLPMLVAFVRDWPPNATAESRAVETRPKGSYWRDCQVFLRDWRFWLVVFYDCGNLIYIWGVNSWLPTYLKMARHFDLRELGFYASLPFVMALIGQLSAGYLCDRISRRAILCFIGLFGAGVLLYFGSIADSPRNAALLIALSAGFEGFATPPLYALILVAIRPSVVAAGTGVMNGLANTVGAFAPLAIGIVIGTSGDFKAGLLVVVLGSTVCSLAMLPLLKRY